MAVAEMKLVRLSGLNDNFDRIAQTCAVNREFHPENAFDIMQSAKTLRRMEDDNPFSDLLLRVRAVAEDADIALDFNNFDGAGMKVDEVWSYIEEFSGKIRFLRDEIQRLEHLAEDGKQVLNQLEHMRGIDVDVHEFFNFKYAKFRFGRMPRELYDHFMPRLNEDDDYYYFPTSVGRSFVYGMYMMPRQFEEKVDTMFASLRFERIYISDRVYGTVEDAESELQKETDDSAKNEEHYKQELESYVKDQTERMLSCYSYARYMCDSFNLRRYAVCTTERFYLYGWVPAKTVGDYTALLDKVEGVTYMITEADDVVGVSPPVKLQNKGIFRPFEPFVEMYGRPSYNEFDPTPLMTVLYTLLFGIMFGDVGQGILLALIGFLMWKLKKMWLGRVLIYAGICGCCFGFFYGSLFGYEHLLPFGFKVLESSANTSLMLQTAVYAGVVIIAIVMVVNIINGLRQKDYEKALFSQNGLAGLILYISVMLLILPLLGFLDVNLSSTPLIICGILVPLLCVICRHPLGKLLSGNPDWLPDSIVDFVLENVFEVIEVLLSYISNTISFLRVGIFALSHAGMMMVVFLLAGENESLPVIIIGNLIVMGIEGLLVGIQVLRLNFYEMFGRFFEADGRQYNPIIINYKIAD